MAITTILQRDGDTWKIDLAKAAKRLGTVSVDDGDPVIVVAESGDRLSCYFRNLGPDPIWVARSAEELDDDATRWLLAMGEAVRDTDSVDAWVVLCDTGDTAEVQWMYVNLGDE